MPPNFRDRFGSLIVLSRRLRSRLICDWWLAALLGLAATPAQAQTEERPSPTDQSQQVPAQPVLTWTYGTTNLLSNG
ncbi:MAG TPA: hypothetical protein VMB21_22110, partial [Candidatus Limnocylindria bacterium]|nr:hypothetical protein [Candidatus Limnocylindria bacterium]